MTTTYTITGMDCAECAKTVEKGVSQLAGVETAAVNFATATLRVQGEIDQTAVLGRIRELGYGVAIPTAEAEPPAPLPSFGRFLWQRPETRWALLGAIFLLPPFFLTELAAIEHPVLDGLAVLAMLCAGWPVFQSAWRAVRINRAITMNALMSVAAIGAVIIGAFTEAGMVMVLFALGEALESYTAERARHAVRELMAVVPRTATRMAHGHLHEVAVAELQVGDVLLVRPGEQIPMDGRVLAGESAVNQANITGESKLIDRTAGDDVYASTLNGAGALEVEVTHLVADNTISRLVRLVAEAQEQRAPTQRFVDQFATYYTPAVMVLAALVAILPPVLWGLPFWNPSPETTGWLYRGLALLVVACPCALVISTPVSLISGMSAGARRGVLFKGGAHLEALSRIKVIAFDKTGTLTAGQPAVVAVRSAACTGESSCAPCDELIALAHAVEQRSEHPLAHAITAEASRAGVQHRYPAAEGVQALAGRGVRGWVAGHEILIGSHSLFDGAIQHSAEQCAAARAEAEQGHTPMLVSTDGAYAGLISVADGVRPSSAAAVAALRGAGIAHLVMLTGDNRPTAEKIGALVGVTAVLAELLPEQKVAAVRQLQAQHGAVAMVGDGLNDAPALATAEVGIAVASGTAQAMETADITLMSGDLSQLPFAYRLSRATMNTIWVNVALAVGVKLAFVGLVVAGLGSMWLAVAADVGTSLVVTLNGMRLMGKK